MIRTICDGGINWNWYLQADFNEDNKTCHIYFYDRWHKYEERGSRHPKHESSTTVQLLESDNRVVHTVRLNYKEDYRVINPAGIFSYKDMTHYESK